MVDRSPGSNLLKFQSVEDLNEGGDEIIYEWVGYRDDCESV